MAQKDQYQSFEKSWALTLNWAHAQGIPTSSVLPVYEMDARRMLAGQGTYQMSEAERTRAILASYNPNNVTPLPTDQPAGGISGFFHNAVHDAENIFTGLEPTHLVNSIYHSALNTFEHPGWMLDPTKNTLAQFIPGVSLVGEYEQGGIKNVFAHPLITALNVLGLASAGTSAILGHTAFGDVMAETLGVDGGRAAFAGRNKIGPIGIGLRAAGKIPTGKAGFSLDASGAVQFGGLTVGQRLAHWSATKGMGGDLADINAKFHELNQSGSATFAAAMKDMADANQALGGLTVDINNDHMADLYQASVGQTLSGSQAAWNLVTLSGKSWRDLADNSLIPVEIKRVLATYQEAIEKLEQQAVDAKELVRLKLPDGTMGAYNVTEAKVITSARDKWSEQEERTAKLSEKSTRLTDVIQRNDDNVKPVFAALADTGGKIAAVIKRPPSQELRTTLLPTDARDRAWHDIGLNQDTVSSLLAVPKATITQGKLIQGIFGDKGLLEQTAAAYQREDFVTFRTLARKMSKQLNSTAFRRVTAGDTSIPVSVARTPDRQLVLGSPAFQQFKAYSDHLYTYAKERAKVEKSLKDTLTPKVKAAQLKTEKLLKDYENVVWKHPAAVWQPLYVRLMNQKISQDEKGALAVDTALATMKRTAKMDAETLAEIRKDPARVVELLRTYIEASHTAPFGTDLEKRIVFDMQSEVLDEIARRRAQGDIPHYVPNFDSTDRLGAYEPGEASYVININPKHYLTPDAAHQRLMDMSNTIYDLHASLNLAMKQRITSDAAQTGIDDYLIPTFGYKQSEMMPLIERENPLLGVERGLGTPQAGLNHYLRNVLDLEIFDPASYGIVGSKHITKGDTIWMPRAILKGLDDTLKQTGWKGLDPSGLITKGTTVFRESVLGYSVRFIAHILFGGSFLQALREPLSFAYMAKAYTMLKDPEFRAAIHTRSTQVGSDNPMAWAVYEFHREGGKTMGRMWAQELMDKLGLDPSKLSSWLKVIPQANFKLTNYITDMQRASIYLSGEARALRHGMSPERAAEEGMKVANKVMGDLAHSTPLERNLLMTIMPFYGWTKHILKYVAQYPVDHPYRAVFLGYLANLNSDSVSKGLYTRIQNLFFLGTPDPEGNVSAIDMRFLNPLRDVANYATLGGLISSLNPAISAPFMMVDPEAVFGGNVLYPNLSYNQLYGTETAAPAGNWVTAVEQFVPEATAIDATLGLSSQYRNLAKSNPNSFAKIIFGALNIPFAQVQHLNLKQIAATQEIDRYRAASAASSQAWQTGDFASLAGYGEVPNPLQTDYNISPAQLQAIYNATLAGEQGAGIAPSELVAPLPTPPGL